MTQRPYPEFLDKACPLTLPEAATIGVAIMLLAQARRCDVGRAASRRTYWDVMADDPLEGQTK